MRRRLAELEASEARLATLVATLPDLVARFDRDLRLTFCNQAFAQQLGGDAAALLSRRPVELGELPLDEARPLEQSLRQALTTGRPVEGELSLSWRANMRRFHLRAVPECGIEPALGLVAVLREITDQRRGGSERSDRDEQLEQRRTMEAIGILAGGVAHDVNNLLAGLQGSLSLLDLDEAVAPTHRFHLRTMEGVVRRGAELSRQLLAFARRGAYEARELDLEAIATQVTATVARSRPRLAIELDFAVDLDAVLADRSQLEQALLALCLTAASGMADGGTLSLRAANATLSPSQAEPHGATAGPVVELVVATSGDGVDAATRARLFEPFFTTRVLGHGSGLGLAVVWATVRNHGGIITVAGEPGRGTVFTLLLPAVVQRPVVDPPPSTRSCDQALILVVDDELTILDLHARLLRALGYQTLTADSGRRAVELLGEHRERIALVLLDLTMPVMSGAQTYDALRAVMPEVKVLLCSGFPGQGEVETLLARGCKGFIQKPFTVAALAEQIELLR